jgi:hypothetical protein
MEFNDFNQLYLLDWALAEIGLIAFHTHRLFERELLWRAMKTPKNIRP